MIWFLAGFLGALVAIYMARPRYRRRILSSARFFQELPQPRPRPDVVFMDYALGPGRTDGATAIREMRAAGYRGHIIGISSDPVANADMRVAGADESLPKKAHLRSYLVWLGSQHLNGETPWGGQRTARGS